MKKVLAVAMIAVLTASTVFAAFTGSVSTSAGYNLDTKEYGFFGAELKNAEITLGLGEDGVATEVAEDASVYASVKASLSVNAKIGEDKLGSDGNLIVGSVAYPGADVVYPITWELKLEEAKVGGKLADQDWYVSIKGMADKASSYATSFYDLDQDDKMDDVGAIPYKNTNGIEAGYAGYKAGFGINGKVNEGTNMAAYGETPVYEFVDGLTFQAAGSYSHNLKNKDEVIGKGAYYTWDDAEGKWVVKNEVDPAAAVGADNHNIGGSFKVAYATDLINVSLAADGAVKNFASKTAAEFIGDAILSAKYDFVSADLYYGYKNRLDAQVAADLNGFNVPLNVKLGVSDVATDARKMNVGLGFEGWGATANLTSKFGFTKAADWEVGLDASYDVMGYATVKGAVSYNSKDMLGMSISAETESIIPGATLFIGWYDAADVLQKNNAQKADDKYYITNIYETTYGEDGKWTGSIVKPSYSVSDDGKTLTDAKGNTIKTVNAHKDLGVIKLGCTIKF